MNAKKSQRVHREKIEQDIFSLQLELDSKTTLRLQSEKEIADLKIQKKQLIEEIKLLQDELEKIRQASKLMQDKAKNKEKSLRSKLGEVDSEWEKIGKEKLLVVQYEQEVEDSKRELQKEIKILKNREDFLISREEALRIKEEGLVKREDHLASEKKRTLQVELRLNDDIKICNDLRTQAEKAKDEAVIVFNEVTQKSKALESKQNRLQELENELKVERYGLNKELVEINTNKELLEKRQNKLNSRERELIQKEEGLKAVRSELKSRELDLNLREIELKDKEKELILRSKNAKA